MRFPFDPAPRRRDCKPRPISRSFPADRLWAICRATRRPGAPGASARARGAARGRRSGATEATVHAARWIGARAARSRGEAGALSSSLRLTACRRATRRRGAAEAGAGTPNGLPPTPPGRGSGTIPAQHRGAVDGGKSRPRDSLTQHDSRPCQAHLVSTKSFPHDRRSRGLASGAAY